MNKLFYGDNLIVLRNDIASESIDLIYLDPPFNSQATYNVLFKSTSGEKSQAQIEAFEDTWHWGEHAERAFDEVIHGSNTDTAELLRALRAFLKENDVMAYLCMMAVRLLELHRVLKATGCIYLHCDPTASHYLKLVMDSVFAPVNFKNEIIWRRTGSHNSAKRYGPIHDTILFYAKSKEYFWQRQYRPYLKGYVESFFNKTDANGSYRSQTLTGSGTRKGESGSPWRGYDPTSKGRHWAFPGVLAEELGIEDEMSQHQKLDLLADDGLLAPSEVDGLPEYRQYLAKSKGVQLQDIWSYQPYTNGVLYGTKECIEDDVRWLDKRGGDERLGFPTQKPVGLLERIIQSSSKENDVVLDPFCGCGTTIHAAQKLRRPWIGIDITHLAISLIEKRLKDAFPGIKYDIHGTPKDLEGARALAAQDKYQFQWWAVSLVDAVPFGGKKKGADTGIDGLIYFKPEGKTTEKAIVSVKSGDNINVSMVRDLAHVVDREKAKIGVFITLVEPTSPMKTEAVKAGSYVTLYGKYPRIQIFTIAELFSGTQPNIPLVDPSAFKKATKEVIETQGKLSL